MNVRQHRMLPAALFVIYATLNATSAMARQNPEFHQPFLEQVYEQVRISPEVPRFFTHSRMVPLLKKLADQAPEVMRLEVIGQSVEGRDLCLVRIGSGPTRLLMWSQMHGDEPTATVALMDVFNFVVQRRSDAFVQELLQNTTLLAIPMLNPDGAERFTRRNAQGLDINRDARDLATPEGRVLKAVRDRYQPHFGFNLHDQNARRTVGRTNKQVAIALMAPPFDWEESDNPVRVAAKKVAAVIYQALGPYLYGHVARYDAGYMPRAFGDAMQHWGTSTVLVESGGWRERDKGYLVKMNFVALLAAWHAIATGSFAEANPALYDALPQNDQELFDLVIREPLILDGSGLPAFRTDIGINFVERVEGDTVVGYRGLIEDVGDMEVFAAKDTVDATGMVLMPGRVVIDPQLGPHDPQFRQRLLDHLRQGHTTVIGVSDFDGSQGGEDIAFPPDELPPVDFGVLLRPPAPAESFDVEVFFRLAARLRDGYLGLFVEPSHPLRQRFAELAGWMSRTLVDVDGLPEPGTNDILSPADIQRQTAVPAAQLGLSDRGLIRPGRRADLLLFDLGKPPGDSQRIAVGRLRAVTLNGDLVLRDGAVLGEPRGQWLTH